MYLTVDMHAAAAATTIAAFHKSDLLSAFWLPAGWLLTTGSTGKTVALGETTGSTGNAVDRGERSGDVVLLALRGLRVSGRVSGGMFVRDSGLGNEARGLGR